MQCNNDRDISHLKLYLTSVGHWGCLKDIFLLSASCWSTSSSRLSPFDCNERSLGALLWQRSGHDIDIILPWFIWKCTWCDNIAMGIEGKHDRTVGAMASRRYPHATTTRDRGWCTLLVA